MVRSSRPLPYVRLCEYRHLVFRLRPRVHRVSVGASTSLAAGVFTLGQHRVRIPLSGPYISFVTGSARLYGTLRGTGCRQARFRYGTIAYIARLKFHGSNLQYSRTSAGLHLAADFKVSTSFAKYVNETPIQRVVRQADPRGQSGTGSSTRRIALARPPEGALDACG